MGETLKNQSVRRRSEEIVAENLETLIAAAPMDKRATGTFAKYVGVGNGTIDRLRKQDAKARISTLERIATRFQLEVWQLLVPGLNLENRPRLMTDAERSIHARFQQVVDDMQAPQPTIHASKRVAHSRRRKP